MLNDEITPVFAPILACGYIHLEGDCYTVWHTNC